MTINIKQSNYDNKYKNNLNMTFSVIKINFYDNFVSFLVLFSFFVIVSFICDSYYINFGIKN
jgi:hypothetical protein